MEQNTIEAITSAPITAATTMPHHDLSMWGLFVQADFVVQFVMFSLLVASVWSWTIIFAKVMKLRELNQRAVQFEESFWAGGSLDSLFDRIGGVPSDPITAVFAAAMREWRRSVNRSQGREKLMATSLQQRVERVMQTTVQKEIESLDRYMGFLASVGSTSPFIGLFGTVWGIMSSFQSIATSKNTSLAVVAPGIAEALLATAIGLIAAIPAVIAYNKISSDINRYANRLEAFTNEFSAIISRQLDETAA